MKLEEALKFALEYENKIRDHYAKGAAIIDDPDGRKVFDTLAREEQSHVDYLEHCLEQWTRTGRVTTSALKSILPEGSAWVGEALKKAQKRPGKRVAQASELELVKIALQLEKDTSALYRELVSKLAPTDQPLFEPFLDIEDGHLTIVQAELDSLQGLGYWFDVMEFSLEGA